MKSFVMIIILSLFTGCGHVNMLVVENDHRDDRDNSVRTAGGIDAPGIDHDCYDCNDSF